MGRRLTEKQAKFVGNLVRQAKEAARRSDGSIAKDAGYTDKVVAEIREGRGRTYQTAKEVCYALGINLDDELIKAGLTDEGAGLAPAELGEYSKGNYSHFIGSFITIRPAYRDPTILKCYRTKINWDVGTSCLRFTEMERVDAECQTGLVYIPRSSSFMYLVTIDRGWVRTVLVSQLVSNASIMRGLILSQYNIFGGNFAPVCAPIVYIKEGSNKNSVLPGEIEIGDPQYDEYIKLLRETLSGSFAKLVLPAEHVVIPAPHKI
jgi:hypothetical protein